MANMCMEFLGWLVQLLKEPIITSDPEELARAVLRSIEQGSINLYMFHGGTNFNFMNGCSTRELGSAHKLRLMITMPF